MYKGSSYQQICADAFALASLQTKLIDSQVILTRFDPVKRHYSPCL